MMRTMVMNYDEPCHHSMVDEGKRHDTCPGLRLERGQCSGDLN